MTLPKTVDGVRLFPNQIVYIRYGGEYPEGSGRYRTREMKVARLGSKKIRLVPYGVAVTGCYREPGQIYADRTLARGKKKATS